MKGLAETAPNAQRSVDTAPEAEIDDDVVLEDGDFAGQILARLHSRMEGTPADAVSKMIADSGMSV